MTVDARIQMALAHPKRSEILGYLMRKRDGTGATELELAIAFGMGIRLVAYHMLVLGQADLVARFEGEQAPDAERSYVAASSS